MTEDHKPLPVSGYTAQPDAKVALVNRYKQQEEKLLREIESLNGGMFYHADAFWLARPAYDDVDIVKGDPRWLAIAKTKFEEAYMALNRAVFQPQRIKLPEDGQ